MGAPKGMWECPKCGDYLVSKEYTYCPRCKVANPQNKNEKEKTSVTQRLGYKQSAPIDNSRNKSKVVTALLAFFLGVTGAHRYYLGYAKEGKIQTAGCICLVFGEVLYFQSYGDSLIALVLLLFGGVVGIWAFIDFIQILLGNLSPADGSSYAEARLAQVQVVNATSETKNNVDALEKLAKLHEQGILTDEEFQQKKADLLAKM